MVTAPAATPNTWPVVLTEAIEVFPELQVPPVTGSVNVVELPLHTVEAPDIVPADAVLVTVIGEVATPVPQVPVTAYEITAEPTETPNTVPVVLTDATEELLDVHTPPDTPLVSVAEAEIHNVVGPDMVPADGAPFTVIGQVANAVPQALETV